MELHVKDVVEEVALGLVGRECQQVAVRRLGVTSNARGQETRSHEAHGLRRMRELAHQNAQNHAIQQCTQLFDAKKPWPVVDNRLRFARALVLALALALALAIALAIALGDG